MQAMLAPSSTKAVTWMYWAVPGKDGKPGSNDARYWKPRRICAPSTSIRTSLRLVSTRLFSVAVMFPYGRVTALSHN